MTNPKDLERLVEKTLEAFGGIDILVNNGGGPPRTPALEITDETSRSRRAAAALRDPPDQPLPPPPSAKRTRPDRQHRSSSVREPIDNLALSNAVRPGVIGWAKTLAREVGPDG